MCVFVSPANTEASDQIHVCPYCDYSSVNEMRIQAHLISQHSQKSQEVLCPLCQEETKDKSQLEKHLVSTHNVTAEGLQRLLPMVGQGDWMMPPPSATSTPVTPQLPIDESGEINTDVLEAEAARLAAEDGECKMHGGCQHNLIKTWLMFSNKGYQGEGEKNRQKASPCQSFCFQSEPRKETLLSKIIH